MRKMDLQEIQNTELLLLEEFDRIARMHELKYTLCAGTLLGAVRHQGFIPWDDDIDVSMPRPDYEKLVRLNRAGALWPAHLEMRCLEDGTLEAPYCKLFDKRTLIREKNYVQKDVQCLWIDIFPVDGLPDTERELRRHYRKALNLCRMNVAAVVRNGFGTSAAAIVLKTVFLKPAARILGRRRVAALQKKLALRYPYQTAARCGMVTWAYDGPGQALLRREYEDLTELLFEGKRFLAVSAWEKYLTGVFGDYMQLPPEEERLTHDLEVYMRDGEVGADQ